MTAAATYQLAAMNRDRSQFAEKVRELANAGSANPIFEAAKKFPSLYNAWRSESDSRTFLSRQ